MSLRTKIGDLRAAEHDGAPGDSAAGASLARDLAEGLAAIKRELAAIVLFALVAFPCVIIWLDGFREIAVLLGYGVGAWAWIRVRAKGVMMAARRRDAEDGDGPDGA